MNDDRQIFIEPNEAYDEQSKRIAYMVNDLSHVANADDNDLDPGFAMMILNACLMLINCDKDRVAYHTELTLGRRVDKLNGRVGKPDAETPNTRPSKEHRQCCMPTKKGNRCSIEADRLRDGLWYCHLHDPFGNNQLRRQGES